MIVKLRTIYFKARDILALRFFYAQLFGVEPKKNKDSNEWVEFDFGSINFSLVPSFEPEPQGSNCIPVFEFPAPVITELAKKVTELGGQVLNESNEGHRWISCIDIEGNEFEISDFHD